MRSPLARVFAVSLALSAFAALAHADPPDKEAPLPVAEDANEPIPSPASPTESHDRVGTKWGGTPIGNFTTDRGFAFGVLAQRFGYGDGKTKPFDNLYTLFAQYETAGSREVGLQFEKTGVTDANLRLLSSIAYSYNPYQRYYGFGANSFRNPVLEGEGYNNYLQANVEIDNSFRKSIAPHLDIYGGLSIIVNRSEPTTPDSQYERDFGGGTFASRYAKFEFGAVLERRDSEFSPSEGDYAAALVTVAPAALSNSQPSWERFDIEYRRYDPFVRGRWLYFASQIRYAVASHDTPLFEAPRLGSLSTLRGFPYNRYLDSNSVTLRGELRSVFLRRDLFGLPLKGGLGLFVDSGRAGDTLSQLASNPTRVAAGFSIFGSYFTDDFLGSADMGFSQDGASLYLHLDHAF